MRVSSVFLWCDACGVIAQRLHHGSGGEISPHCLRMMSKASLRGFCQHLPRLRVLLGRVNRARPRWGGFAQGLVSTKKIKKNKSLLNLQTGGGWGAWFLFARAFMGRECAHLIRARRLLCFRLAFALAYAGLCESISLCWLELRSMPRHRYTASELMPHRLQEEKPNATAAKKKKKTVLVD